ncbi:MAG TPA: UvrD-helicase domain-containing protein, partial [Ilumatobacteraceae bacterium]|nr:UvrD-helicase domain-containing protein [Ilumatobacteraceae bacterium]
MTEQLDLFAAAADEPGRPEAPDQLERDRVANDLDTTLFVEAGAGSGKTTALVARVVALVRSGVPIGSIAAITFTEKAAAELRHRIRAELADQPDALADLDLAPIGTLHAFARRLLSEFPVEAELPPRFAVLDEVQSATAFHERFTDFLEELLDDPNSVRLVDLCQHDGFGIERGARRMADDFQANWDLVEARVSPELPPGADDDHHRRAMQHACAAAGAFSAPPDDTQPEVVADLQAMAAELSGPIPLGELLQLLPRIDKLSLRGGNKDRWKKHHGDDRVLDHYREALAACKATAVAARRAFDEERRLTLGALLHRFTMSSVELRRLDGALEFHDLLVLARRLVATHAEVRARLHDRYTRVLLDEFQDTDPIQLELAVRITAPPDQQPDDWRALRPVPGRLTVVGDPKQSIYRFRRADIAQFLRARDQLGADKASLQANFRSAEPVIRWINHTMAALIVEQDGVQPAYEPLLPARSGAHDHGTVTVLGAEPHGDAPNAETLRE